MDVLIPFAIILFLVVINGVFVAAEFAIIGVRPSRLEQLADDGNRTAKNLLSIARNPAKADRYVATAQLGISLASLGLGMYGEPFIAHLIEPALHDWFGLEGEIVHTIGFLTGLAFITYLHVVIGEMVPKSLALHNAERTVFALATPMFIMQRLFSFAVTILNDIGLIILKLIRVSPPSHGSRLHTPDELELIVTESFAGGMLEEDEQQLVSNIFDFHERRVSQIMTPRVHIDAVPVTLSEEDLVKHVIDSPNSRFPVYEGTLDNVIGVLHVKDLIHQQLDGKPFNVRQMLHRAPTVPETLPADTLLAMLKREHVHLAVVLDEYGGTAGIVTMEDLIEEIVGEVHDEFDVDEDEPLRVVQPGHLVVQGTVPLDELDDYVNLGDHGYDVESVGGLVLAELNRPPAVGDEVAINNVTFRVELVDGLGIQQLSVHFAPSTDERTESAH